MVLKYVEWINASVYKNSPSMRKMLEVFVAGHQEVTKRRWARIAQIRGGIHTSDRDPYNHLTVLLKKYRKHHGFKVHTHIEPEEAEERAKNFKQ